MSEMHNSHQLDKTNAASSFHVPEFDAVADIYEEQHANSIKLSGENPEYFARHKIALLHETVSAENLQSSNILDFGAGIGSSAPHLSALFPDSAITALDVSEASLKICAQRGLSRVKTLPYNGKAIPLPDNSQDIAFTACVFHHIDAADHVALLKEIRRVVKPGGIFALFEHNPWNPLTRRAVANCPFDENAVLINARLMRKRMALAGFSDMQCNYCLFFPKFLAPLRPLEKHLKWLPIGAQYMLIAG